MVTIKSKREETTREMLCNESLHSALSALRAAEDKLVIWSERQTVRQCCMSILERIYSGCFVPLIENYSGGEKITDTTNTMVDEEEAQAMVVIDKKTFFALHLANEQESNEQTRYFCEIFPLESLLVIRILFRLPEFADGGACLTKSQHVLLQDIETLLDALIYRVSATEWWKIGSAQFETNTEAKNAIVEVLRPYFV